MSDNIFLWSQERLVIVDSRWRAILQPSHARPLNPGEFG